MNTIIAITTTQHLTTEQSDNLAARITAQVGDGYTVLVLPPGMGIARQPVGDLLGLSAPGHMPDGQQRPIDAAYEDYRRALAEYHRRLAEYYAAPEVEVTTYPLGPHDKGYRVIDRNAEVPGAAPLTTLQRRVSAGMDVPPPPPPPPTRHMVNGAQTAESKTETEAWSARNAEWRRHMESIRSV